MNLKILSKATQQILVQKIPYVPHFIKRFDRFFYTTVYSYVEFILTFFDIKVIKKDSLKLINLTANILTVKNTTFSCEIFPHALPVPIGHLITVPSTAD